MDIKEMVYQGVEWIYLEQVRSRWWAFVYVVMNVRSFIEDEYLLTS